MYKEYSFDENGKVDIENLKANRIPEEEYILMHQKLPIVCHDVFIKYQGGFLLVTREKAPCNRLIWPIGGRAERGTTIEESLKKKSKEECGLEIKNLKLLGIGRHFCNTEPFGHGKGTDTPTLVFLAEGYGKLNLDSLHNTPLIVKKRDYKKLKSNLHPYVRDFLEIALKK